MQPHRLGMTNIHALQATSIDGHNVSLGSYAGKVLLIVNVASKCGLTPQYKALQATYEANKDAGLVVLGFPCNQFAGQEPGTAAEIQNFCELNYRVTFPMFAKVDVNGEGAHPLFAALTSTETKPEEKGPIKWNFGKFLIGKNGDVLARFAPTEDPSGAVIQAAIAAALLA